MKLSPTTALNLFGDQTSLLQQMMAFQMQVHRNLYQEVAFYGCCEKVTSAQLYYSGGKIQHSVIPGCLKSVVLIFSWLCVISKVH